MSASLQADQPSPEVSRTGAMDSLASTSISTNERDVDTQVLQGEDVAGKVRKRDFFRFGKKESEEKKNKSRSSASDTVPALAGSGGLRAASPLAVNATASPPRSLPHGVPSSPGRQALRSVSPRTHSPASSLIFERNVQEDVPQASPQIPSHIVTENHIPPALDATSEAITDSKLDPDTVEIVTHASHQPAAATLGGNLGEHPMMGSVHEETPISFLRQDTDNASNYGSLDTGDVRRLSFISFADVVHAEQEMGDHRRDSGHIPSLSGHPALNSPRSPSPIRSPVSSQALGTSPSTSIAPSVKGQEASPTRGLRATGSPLPGTSSPVPMGELNIETMRQALRKTGSGDLSAFRNSVSNAATDEPVVERAAR